MQIQELAFVPVEKVEQSPQKSATASPAKILRRRASRT
jgi:hypothetical protein